jgi:tetratricopeptide (TPR) repeat protein/SAM-dependent methyltransferase
MNNFELAKSRFLAALEHHRQGRLEQAEADYREADALQPGRASVQNNLAAVLVMQQRHEEALPLCRSVLAADPNNAQALGNLAVCLLQLGEGRAALEHIEQALRANPADGQALLNRGVILEAMGRPREALMSFDSAIGLLPDAAPARGNHAALKAKLERAEQALRDVKEALRRDPQSARAAADFFVLLRGGRIAPDYRDAELQDLAIRALREGWGRPRFVVEPLLRLMETDPEISALLADAEAGAAQADRAVAVLCRKPLLMVLLESDVLIDERYERLMAAVRQALLRCALTPGFEPAGKELALHCALARQCFINEYAYDAAEKEMRQAEQLRERMVGQLQAGVPCAPPMIAAVACYFPLWSLPGSAALARTPAPDALAGVLRQQVADPLLERKLREAMPRLTDIDDPVSQEVRRQYEDNPFPRWTVLLRPMAAPVPLGRHLSGQFPAARPGEDHDGRPFQALIAGCGTGQHPIDVARKYAGIQLLAIDLSLGSLAYAQRKAEEMKLTNLRFAQADILRLGGTGLRFSLIESVGVLHHMREPERGLRVLAGLLEPGGMMKLGLYSELGRRHIVAVRRLIAERGHAATPQGMRRLRQEIMQLDRVAPERRVMLFGDFFSLSECRDLLFHVQEHRYGIPDLARMLSAVDLKFIGFELASEVMSRYRARFPGDAAFTNLDHWHAFEVEQPHTFANMYQFWVHKPRG